MAQRSRDLKIINETFLHVLCRHIVQSTRRISVQAEEFQLCLVGISVFSAIPPSFYSSERRFFIQQFTNGEFYSGGMAFYRTTPLHKKNEGALEETASLTRQLSQRSWIEKTFYRRECCKFIPSARDHTKCCCGRGEVWHTQHFYPTDQAEDGEKWHPYRHTNAKPTDAFGTLEFQGAPHPSKALYVRLSSFDTKPEHVLQLLQKHWGLDLPKLLITIHGGIVNFDLQPKLKRVFRKGLLKAAKTTGAWIITGGTNTGVTRHVGDAISDRTTKLKNKVVAIGIAPWGVVENKDDLVGHDLIVPYHCISSPKTNNAVLNSNHSYFLLTDNGTVGKYGGEVMFRKKLEKYITQQKICIRSGFKGHGVPVICVVLEGGANTIRSVLEYVTDSPPVPVVVCDGSGRAADLLAFTHKYTLEDGTMTESLRDQLILTIQKTFQYTQEQAEKLFIELMLCVKKRELITVFRMGEGTQDIDLAILTALLKGTNAGAPDQLSLALTWDRVDIARSHIFVYGQEWPEGSLEQAMMDALINDRVDFVKLLLENGVSMQTFLKIPRLEELYNTKQGPSNTLRYLVRDIKKHMPSTYRYTLPDIGLVIQHLMGGAFRSTYCRKRFRQKYYALKKSDITVGNIVTSLPQIINTKQAEDLFPYPFHDLMIWAVLMKRQKMALFMWQHGEEAMAKALMACKLYKAMAHEADQDDLEVDISDQLRSYAKEFQTLALELIEHCYRIDDDYTQQLLTYELKNFSDQTCLSLAVSANHREFIAHTCCQVLLNDMWMGGLRMRKNTSFKVLLGIFLPFTILALEFKSKEELLLMPQTMEEHLDELDDETDYESNSVSSFDEDNPEDFEDLDSACTPALHNTVKENGTLPMNSSHCSTLAPTSLHKRKSPLRLGTKVYEFYNAPITVFWAHTISYFFFLFLYTFVVLVKTIPNPRWQEYYVIAYIFTQALERLRQIIASEPGKLSMKLRVFCGQLWNIWDTFAIILFFIGVGLRFHPPTLKASRLLYTVDIVFWYIRILEILSVNKYLGPYVKIIGKLVVDMSYFIVILFIVLISFGVVRQSVHFQDEEPSWSIVRNVFFYPYWMIYGELFADLIDPCDNEETCVYGAWVAPALMCAYLLVANILMVNLLIARFNATFIRNNQHTREIWKFQRYQLIIDYEMRPIIPPPFIFFNHLFLIGKYIKRRCKGKREYFDNGLKLFLSHEDTEKLHDFEEECVEDYFRDKENKFHSSSEERIRIINERSENMSMRVEDMNQKENSIKLSMNSADYRLSKLEDLSLQTSEALQQIANVLQKLNIETLSVLSTNMSTASQDSIVSMQDLPPLDESTHLVTTKSGIMDASGQGNVQSISMRSCPSPGLVHSKHPVKSEYLQKFTDYTISDKDYDKPLQRVNSLKALTQQRSRTSSVSSNDSAKDKTVKPSSASLLRRRHKSAGLSVDVNKARGELHPLKEDQKQTPDATGCAGVNPTQKNTSLYTTARMSTEPHLSTSSNENQNLNAFDYDSDVVKFCTEALVNPAPLKDVPNPSSFVSADTTSTVPAITPLLVSSRAEYTSITDQIDTSCMIDRSPPRSPTTTTPFLADILSDPETKREFNAWKTEEALKKAEETEHRKMEKVIRHRLRQISLDETDSISDIAKIVISEMEQHEKMRSVTPDEVEDIDDFHDSVETIIPKDTDNLLENIDTVNLSESKV